MPVYEYECSACEHRFEEWQKMSDPPVRTCPKCKKKKVEKLISHTAFQLKGGGWYADLYSSSKTGTGSKDGGEGKDSGGKDGAGKDGGSSEGSGERSGKEKDTASKSTVPKKDGKGDAKETKKKDSPKKT